MSAAGSIGELNARYLNPVIGAHADHNRADFIFLRAQSATLRALPWETRLRPLRTWSELAIYSIMVLVVAISSTALLRL
jgi:hypothetical protein